MPKFMLLGHGGTPATTQEGRDASMQAWMAWFEQVGGAVVDAGAPFQDKQFIGSVDQPTAGNGYMIVQADDMDAAKALAASCPAADEGTGLEVIQLVEMGPK